MLQIRLLAWSLGMGIVVTSSLYGSFSHADPLKAGPTSMGSTLSGITAPPVLAIVRGMESRQLSFASVTGETAMVLRTIPTLSTQIAVGDTTFIPYLGAGFGGGYATEFDRSLHTLSAASSGFSSTTPGLRNLFGPHLVPNEVQLGIRFPF